MLCECLAECCSASSISADTGDQFFDSVKRQAPDPLCKQEETGEAVNTVHTRWSLLSKLWRTAVLETR